MNQDKALKNYVLEALDWEPSVDSAAIGVSVKDGVVTLSGEVPNFAQKQAAERVASQVKGVRALVLDIEVKLPASGKPSDQEIAARAARVLDWNIEVPTGVTVEVEHGWITLQGEVDWQYQKNSAASSVGYLDGVRGVINKITVRPRVVPADVKDRIRKAFDRDADIEAERIEVQVNGSRVILKGRVNAFRERRVAEEAAWMVPGVSHVEDQITVA